MASERSPTHLAGEARGKPYDGVSDALYSALFERSITYTVEALEFESGLRLKRLGVYINRNHINGMAIMV